MADEQNYKQALERAKNIYGASEDKDILRTLETIFPELAESEEERIRKEILMCVKEYGPSDLDKPLYYKMIDWLEKQKEPTDKGEISDGYHTFNELYYYRMLYNAAFFNLLPKGWVHKSKKHHDGEECLGGGWFIVMANLPTGQISNHYKLKDWDLFQIPEKEKADKWDGHTPQEAAERLYKYLLEKQREQKSTWSEEDEKFFKTALWHISYSVSNGKSTDVRCDTTEWLKSLKERVQPQNTWKPSDKQMEALKDAVGLYKSTHFDSQHYKIESLYDNLKKLMEE